MANVLDNPNKEGMEKVMNKNEGVKKANSILHTMSEDEELKKLQINTENIIEITGLTKEEINKL